MGATGEAEAGREILEAVAHHDEYEAMAIAGCLFHDDGLEARRRIRILADNPGLFYRTKYRELVAWAARLVQEGAEPANLMRDEWWGLLAAAVRHRDPGFWERSGKEAIAGLLDHFSGSLNFEWVIDQLGALQVLRERQLALQRELEATKRMSPDELEEFWTEQNAKLQAMKIERREALREAADVYGLFRALEERHRRLQKGEGITLGIPDVDNAMRGMSSGELVCLAARAGVGKTTLCANILHHVSRPAMKDRGAWAVVFSMDMGAPEFLEKMVQRSAGVSWREVLHPSKRKRIETEGLSRYDRTLIDNSSSLTVAQLEAKVMTYRQKMADELGEDLPPALIVIDHHGHVHPTNQNLRSRYERVSESIQEVKQAAKRLETVILLCVQLSRKAGEGEIEVTLDMLRDSGVIEEEGDLVLGAWRPRKGKPDDDTLILKVMKARRMGGTQIDMEWRPELAFVAQLGKEADWWEGTGATPEPDPWGLETEPRKPTQSPIDFDKWRERDREPGDDDLPEDPPF